MAKKVACRPEVSEGQEESNWGALVVGRVKRAWVGTTRYMDAGYRL